MDKDLQETIAQGREFEALLLHPGWKKIDTLMESFEKARIDDLLNYRGSDAAAIVARHTSARIMYELRTAIKQYINESINMAREIVRDNGSV